MLNMELLLIRLDYAIGLRNGDKIITIDNQHVENFLEITSDIILNNRKTIQVERDGATHKY